MRIKRALVIAAHPDDECLGCGGVISKFIEIGIEIKVLFLGEGSTCRYDNQSCREALKAIELRRRNAILALKILGVKDYDFFDLPCGRFDQVPVIEINKILESSIKEYKPDTVFTHSEFDANNDHRVVYRSSIMSTRPCNEITIERLFSYEVLSSSEWNYTKTFQPNYFFSLETRHIDAKWEALKTYKNEMRVYPFPRSYEGVQNLAMRRGMQSGAKLAEAFLLIREFN